MAKKQKIWLGIFLAMFLIPEIIWLSGVRGTIDIPWYPVSSYDQLKNIALSFFTTLVPFIGLLGLAKIITEVRVERKRKIIIFSLLIPLLCLFGFLSIMLAWVMIYYINGAPQIG